MLDASTRSGAPRSWDDLSKLTPADRAKHCPISTSGRKAARNSPGRRGQGVNATHGDPHGRGKAVCRRRLLISRCRGGELCRPTRLPDQRPRKTVRAYRLHLTWKCRKIQQRRSMAATMQRISDRVQIVGRRFDDLACCGWRRRSRQCARAKAVAGAAEEIRNRSRHCERSEAIQRSQRKAGLLRRFAARNDDKAKNRKEPPDGL